METNQPLLFESMDTASAVNFADAIKVSIPKNTSLNDCTTFPTDGLPKIICKLIKECSKVYNVPEEMFAISFIVAMGAAIKKKVKLKDKFINYSQLWAMIVAESGIGKTTPLNVAFTPLRNADKELYKNHKSTARVVNDGAKCVFMDRYLNSDATPEALYQILADGSGITIVRDELAGWFKDFCRYNKSGEVENYLSIFNNESFTIARKGEGIISVDEPFMSIIGTIQPSVLLRILKDNALVENGFIGRFVFLFPMDCPKAYYNENVVDDVLMNSYTQLIADLCSMKEVEICLSVGAKQIYGTYYNRLVDKIDRAQSLFLKSHYSKLHIIVLRIAVIIASVNNLSNVSCSSLEVSEKDMEYCTRVCAYFEYMAERIDSYILGNDKEPLVKYTNEKLLKEIHLRWGIKNQTKLAEALGITQQFISKTLKS